MWMWNGCQVLLELRITHSSVVLRCTIWSSRLASKIWWSIQKMVCGGLIGGPNWKTCNPSRPDHSSLALGGVPGQGASLPRDRGLQESDAQARGLGGTVVRRGQGLARVTPLPVAAMMCLRVEDRIRIEGYPTSPGP